MELGTRIAVVGVSAAGKSVFARRLAVLTQLPLVHTDRIMWKPGWHYVGDEETVRALTEASAGDRWIIEGFIEKGAFDAVLNRADSIIYLDYPRYVPALRYLKRWFAHRRDPRPELSGCPDTFSFSFLKRIWDRKEVYRLNKFLGSMPQPEKVIRLASPHAAEAFLRRLKP